MTINHLFILVTASKLAAARSFYASALVPLGYTEMIAVKNEKMELYGYGSDYPYLWLKPLPVGTNPVPTHVAIDAPDNAAVDKFHEAALLAGGIDNGLPGVRSAMSRQPYYASFVTDPDGNNIEAVCVKK